ncbi:MAG: hypothetical protein SFU21_12635 [Flavihumibacter sp.]|nr:hypothetical protein [Flavihumibacter sp.]
MSTYRLLRDNKESGPYSFDELTAKGFKAYDLVWVEGKSAGWRYPSELPEFKTMAPVVEEQPFDRFYKKPADEPTAPSVLEQKRLARLQKEKEAQQQYTKPQPAKTVTPTHTVAANPPATASIKAVAPHIHVTLPVSQTTVASTATAATKEPVKPVTNTTAQRTAQLSDNTTTATAVPNTILQTTAKPANTVTETIAYKQAGFNWTTYMGLGVGILTLLGLGIMIGMSVVKQQNELVKQQYIEQQLKPTQKQEPKETETPPATVAVEPMPVAGVTEASHLNSGNAGNKPAAGLQNKKETANKAAPAVVVTNNNTDAEKPIATVATENTKNKPALPPAINLEKQVSVASNNYKVGAFGGITGLECTLNNQSKYSIDAVQVEVQYLLANDKVFKSSIIEFKDIAPGNRQTIALPKSNRGIKVNTRVIAVHSKEINTAGTTVKL